MGGYFRIDVEPARAIVGQDGILRPVDNRPSCSEVQLTGGPIDNRPAGFHPRIPSFYEKAVLCQAENSSFLTSRNSVPGIPPISVCLGLAGGVVKGAPVLGGEANP